jgi:hypothetical protein
MPPAAPRNHEMSFRAKRGILLCAGGSPKKNQGEIPRSALRKDDAYVLYIQRNRSDELASSFCLSRAAKRLSMLGMTADFRVGLPSRRGKRNNDKKSATQNLVLPGVLIHAVHGW